MPIETAAPPATPDGRSVAPPVHAPVRSTAASAPPGAGRGGESASRKSAREQMRNIGTGMKDGSITDRNAHIPASPQTGTESTTPTIESPTLPKHEARPLVATPEQQAKEAKQAKKAAEETPEQKTAKAERAKALVTAKRNLIHALWKPSDFDKFTDDEIIARSEEYAPIRAQRDREYSEMAKRANAPQPRAQDGTFAEKKETPATSAPQTAAPAQAAQSDIPADIQADLQAAESQIGPEATKLLGVIVGKLAANMGQRAATSEMMAKEVLIQQGQNLFAQKYPDQATATPEAFLDVTENFKALLSSGLYKEGQVQKAWTDALHMQFGSPNEVRNAQREALGRQTAAKNGHVDPGAQRTPATNGSPPTKKDQLRMVGELMKANPRAPLADLQRQVAGMLG